MEVEFPAEEISGSSFNSLSLPSALVWCKHGPFAVNAVSDSDISLSLVYVI